MARVYDSWLGGKDHFAADRAVAERNGAAYPDVLAAVQAQRAFLVAQAAAPAARVVGTRPPRWPPAREAARHATNAQQQRYLSQQITRLRGQI